MKNLNQPSKLSLKKSVVVKFKNTDKSPKNRLTFCSIRITDTLF